MKRLVLLALVAAPFAAPAFAQETPAETVGGRTVLHQKVIEVDFDATNVNALSDTPGLAYVRETHHEGFRSFIQLRANFDDTMAESIDQVK
jgi:hypothetical protein